MGRGMAKRSELRKAAMIRAGWACEFPGCELSTDWPNPLEMSHLRGSGMGGSKHRDVLDNVWIACKFHHVWLDGGLLPGRRHENEEILRVVLDRYWEERQ